jgi:flagellar basal body-associated protein FliL
MAEQQAEPQAPQEGQAKPPGRGKKNLIFGGIFLGIMIAEGVGVALVVKHFSSSPAPAEAAAPAHGAAPAGAHGGLNPAEGQKKAEDAELEVAAFRAQNSKARQVVMYDVKVVVAVSGEKEAELKGLLERKKAAIQDRFISTIRAADPAVLAEPDCATLRQQFRQILVELLGNEELVKNVLIPQFTSYRAD